MKEKVMRYSVEVKMFVTVVVAASLLAGAVNAQPRFQGKFTLPYEVRWGNALLPAGEYSIRMVPSEPAVILSTNGKAHFIRVAPITEESRKGSTCLFIMVRGDERRVRSLNLPQLGQSLAWERLSKTEREKLASADREQAVPVIVAGR
jgi:hypothetical protein